MCHKIHRNILSNDLADFWYHESSTNNYTVVIMSLQNLCLGKCWKLVRFTLKTVCKLWGRYGFYVWHFLEQQLSWGRYQTVIDFVCNLSIFKSLCLVHEKNSLSTYLVAQLTVYVLFRHYGWFMFCPELQ